MRALHSMMWAVLAKSYGDVEVLHQVDLSFASTSSPSVTDAEGNTNQAAFWGSDDA